jgi:hypothetical protein
MTHLNCKIFLLYALFVVGCQTENTDNRLIVRKEKTVIRQLPDEKSEVLCSLEKGDQLEDLGETGKVESVFKIGNDIFQSPWLKVKTSSDITGWVLAWALKPIRNDDEWLLRKRVDTYWGKNLRTERDSWKKGFLSINTQEEWFKVWRDGMHLRDTLLHLLHKQPEISGSLNYQWISELLPGFVYQETVMPGRPCLFADYRIWHQKALSTEGHQDNALAGLLLSLFPLDSIESNFPYWVFQLDDQHYASQLGLGRHSTILRSLDSLSLSAPMAGKECKAIKMKLFEDIMDQKSQYWQPATKIREELANLLANPPACLTREDIDALNIRLRMFDNPAQHGIRVNLRSGL